MMDPLDDSAFALADFGLAAYTSGPPLTLRCGSPGYVAPEIFKCEAYDGKVDVFSAGILMYIFLSGKAVYAGNSPRTILSSNKRGDISYPEKYWKGISADARDLVQNLLALDPIDRPRASDALQHPWFNPIIAPRVLRSTSHTATDFNVRLTRRSPYNLGNRTYSVKTPNNRLPKLARRID